MTAPAPQGINSGILFFTGIPDGHQLRPGPVLHRSDLLWLTRYVQALNDLTPLLPTRVTVTGPRATGSALDDPMEIAVVVNDDERPSLEPRLPEIAATASSMTPSIQPTSASSHPSSGTASKRAKPQEPITTPGWHPHTKDSISLQILIKPTSTHNQHPHRRTPSANSPLKRVSIHASPNGTRP